MTPTQYGKSIIVAFAVIWLATTKNLRIPIIAPKDEQAKIIMDYIVMHIFDNPMFLVGLVDVKGLEKMKTQRSRNRITWEHGSDIRVLSANVKQVSSKGMGLMGFMGDVIITDESALIPNENYVKIIRMLGGKVLKSRLIKIGNPFERNHFLKTWNSDRYYKIWIDYKQAIKEGRLTGDFIEEMKEGMTPEDFDILYGVKFPDSLSKDAVFTVTSIDKSKNPTSWTKMEGKKKVIWRGELFAGLDPSRKGGDDTILTIFKFGGDRIRVIRQFKLENTNDSIIMAKEVIDILKDWEIKMIGVDAVGLGGPIADYLREYRDRKYEVVDYVAGEKATVDTYFNKKAELVYTLRKYMEKGWVDLSKCSGQMFEDLLGYKGKYMSDRKMRVIDPDDSPDYGDSLLAGLYCIWGSTQPNISFI